MTSSLTIDLDDKYCCKINNITREPYTNLNDIYDRSKIKVCVFYIELVWLSYLTLHTNWTKIGIILFFPLTVNKRGNSSFYKTFVKSISPIFLITFLRVYNYQHLFKYGQHFILFGILTISGTKALKIFIVEFKKKYVFQLRYMPTSENFFLVSATEKSGITAAREDLYIALSEVVYN